MARFDRCFVALQFTSGNGLQFQPFPATDEDLLYAVDAGPLDEKRRIYHKPSEEYVRFWVDEILTRQALLKKIADAAVCRRDRKLRRDSSNFRAQG